MTQKDRALYVTFMSNMGLVFFVVIGLIPLLVLFLFDILLLHPYASVLGLLVGGIIKSHLTKLNQPK